MKDHMDEQPGIFLLDTNVHQLLYIGEARVSFLLKMEKIEYPHQRGKNELRLIISTTVTVVIRARAEP